MKKQIFSLIILTLFLFGLNSCFKIQIKAPTNEDVRLVSYGKAIEIKSKKVWYVFWGLVPVSDNTTQDILLGARKARLESKMSFFDGFISIITAFIISPRTVEVSVVE
jgi:hypothetical protein